MLCGDHVWLKNGIVKLRKIKSDKLLVKLFPREFINLRQLERNFGARRIMFKS